jgi:large subunit ribosomal protein L30
MAAKKKAGVPKSGTLKIKYFKSAIGSPTKHKLVIRSLGFRRLNQIVERVDTPSIRGMVAKVPHLVTILESE